MVVQERRRGRVRRHEAEVRERVADALVLLGYQACKDYSSFLSKNALTAQKDPNFRQKY